MADIEVLIRISEEDYRNFKEDEKYIKENAETESYSLDRLEVALLNGTPLPKGHGRLIDADYVLNKMNTTDAQPITPTEHYAWDFAKALFRKALTIIETDKN